MTNRPLANLHQWVNQTIPPRCAQTATLIDVTVAVASVPAEADWLRLTDRMNRDRMKLGLTHEALARATGLPRMTIARLLGADNARHHPRFTHVGLIEQVLGWWPGRAMELLAGVTSASPPSVSQEGGMPSPDDRLEAPWSPSEVATLNAYQRAEWLGSVVCDGTHGEAPPKLLAQQDGWRCPDPGCGKRKTWVAGGATNRAQWETQGVTGGAQ